MALSVLSRGSILRFSNHVMALRETIAQSGFSPESKRSSGSDGAGWAERGAGTSFTPGLRPSTLLIPLLCAAGLVGGDGGIR
jgi:hypothetical protein